VECNPHLSKAHLAVWVPAALSCGELSDSKVDALGQVPLFAGCTRKELAFLVTRTDEVDVPAGQTLIKQGSPGDTFYLLLDGEASVEVDGQDRPSLRTGSFFGEISMLDRGPATATVATTTPAKLMVMSHAQFRDAIKGDDRLLSLVMSAMAERLRRDSLQGKPA
jgi:CRP/FNR family transcriptional regulator, cyclic AMP receptor protein